MPISRYRCKKCGKEFQIFQRITDSPLKKCSFCDGKVDLIPTPLFFNTPSFSLAFAEKEEKQTKPSKAAVKSHKNEKAKPKRAASQKLKKTNKKTNKMKKQKSKKTNKNKKQKK